MYLHVRCVGVSGRQGMKSHLNSRRFFQANFQCPTCKRYDRTLAQYSLCFPCKQGNHRVGIFCLIALLKVFQKAKHFDLLHPLNDMHSGEPAAVFQIPYSPQGLLLLRSTRPNFAFEWNYFVKLLLRSSWFSIFLYSDTNKLKLS